MTPKQISDLMAKYMVMDLPIPEHLYEDMMVALYEEQNGEDKQTGCETPDAIRSMG